MRLLELRAVPLAMALAVAFGPIAAAEQEDPRTAAPAAAGQPEAEAVGVVEAAELADEPAEGDSSTEEASCESEDRFRTYQLSYIESNQALALLKALGYNTAKFKAGGNDEPPFTVGKRLGDLTKPVVVQLLDVEKPELDSIPGATGLGGSALTRVTAAVPQQRLLIVWDACKPEEVKKLLELLHEQIDVPARQILIEALVIELDRSLFNELGLGYEAKKDGWTGEFGAEGAAFSPLSLIFRRPSVKTLLELTVRLQALVDDGDARVLSRPSVLVLNGRQARIMVGDKVPYIKVEADDAGILASETEYADVGITLNLKPRVSNDDSEVSMQIETLVSSAPPSSGSVAGPPISAREVQTTVRVANNTPFIIAGLISTSESDRRAGIPVLSRIPGLGRLFRRTTRLRDDQEIVVVIVPHVIPAEDRSFSFTIARDSELFDQTGLELFRNIYRVRSDDVFDLDFIRQSTFYRCLEKTAQGQAKDLSELLAATGRPVAGGDVAEVARALRQWSDENPAQLAGVLRQWFSAEDQEEARDDAAVSAVTDQFIDLLEGRIPGEDTLAKRMVLGIVERQGLGQFVDPGRIIFFKAGGTADNPTASGQAILNVERLVPELGPLDRECTTVRMLYPTGLTSSRMLFDPPSARVETLPDKIATEEDYYCQLRQGNCLSSDGNRWRQLAVLLNDCFERRGGSAFDFLRNVLVLKRILDLNPTLPLSIDGFHVGRELVMPSPEDLAERDHLVDREAAQLFFETLDYYYAFELKIRAGLNSIRWLGLEPPPECTVEVVNRLDWVADPDPACSCPPSP